MVILPTVRERERGISDDYINALTWLHAYLDARTNRIPGVNVESLAVALRANGHVRTYGEYCEERPWAKLEDGDTPERRELDRAITWINAQFIAGVFYDDDAVALQLYGFCRALVLFVRGDGPVPDVPLNGHCRRASP